MSAFTPSKILITGATGFLGFELVVEAFKLWPSCKIVVGIRSASGVPASVRWQEHLAKVSKFRKLPNGIAEGVKVVELDLSVNAKVKVLERLDCEMIYHSAASTDLASPLALARQNNLLTTQNLIRAARKNPQLKRFVHISTAYVSARARGTVDECNASHSFNNHYERSKYEAECTVRESGLDFSILRPSMIVGRSDDGYVKGTRVIYAVLRAWFSGVLPYLPIDLDAKIDVVPVDYVAKSTLILSCMQSTKDQTIHLCAGEDATLVRDIVREAQKIFGQRREKFISFFWARLLCHPLIRFMLPHGIRQVVEAMLWHVPYFSDYGRIFSLQHFKSVTSNDLPLAPKFSAYAPTLFNYVRDSKWGKKQIYSEGTRSWDSQFQMPEKLPGSQDLAAV